MGSSYEDIIHSDIYKFVIGPHNKEFSVHGAAISGLSKPLGVLLNGNMREASEKRVEWPDVDEKTFVRFTQWAYTENYLAEEPDIFLDHSLIENVSSTTEGQILPEDNKKSDEPLYSLTTFESIQAHSRDFCTNQSCVSYGQRNAQATSRQETCLICMQAYDTAACANCFSVYSDCPSCDPLNDPDGASRLNKNCGYRGRAQNKTRSVTCLKCRTSYSTSYCRYCRSVFSACETCKATNKEGPSSKRSELINQFLDSTRTVYPTPTAVFSARKNMEGCEDYTGVFLCHAKLYILGDKYNIPPLKQLSLHRLHATLKKFTLYPSRMNDIATLTKYIFENTVPDDKIREMCTLYYACIVEDAWKHGGLKLLIDEIPDFALGLISKMSERLD